MTALPASCTCAAPDAERRTLIHATAAAGGLAAVGAAVPLVSSLAPSERARSLGAAVEVDIAGLPPGGMLTVEWRGKPVWIVRRTPEMLQSLQGLDAQLADPASAKDQQPDYARNTHRSIQPEVFVAIGICTHLGCSPVEKFKAGPQPSLPDNWVGGFFCPCHGSTFDFSARVFKDKPAPANLVVPPYTYLSDTRLLIGEYKKA